MKFSLILFFLVIALATTITWSQTTKNQTKMHGKVKSSATTVKMHMKHKQPALGATTKVSKKGEKAH